MARVCKNCYRNLLLKQNSGASCYHRPHAASDGLLFKPEQLAVAMLHAESIMRIDVEIKRGTHGRVSVPQACYDKLADWYNETH